MDTPVMVGSREHVSDMFTSLHMYIIITLFRMDSNPQNHHSLPLGIILAIVCLTGLTRQALLSRRTEVRC
jgi:hypothetical protein